MLVLSVLLPVLASATYFEVDKDVHRAKYVGDLKSAIPVSPRSAIVQKLHWYYSTVPIVATFHSTKYAGLVVDCIPYDQQPALREASAAVREEAAKKLPPQSSAVSSPDLVPCPWPSVAIPRFRVGSNSTLVVPNKVAPPTSQGRNASLLGGYSWLQNTPSNVPGSTYAYITTGLTSSMPSPVEPSAQDHTINQLWWVTQPRTSPSFSSLETGWIDCDYWTSSPTTSIFTFSTYDDYQGNSGDQYNTAGGFVMYPGAPFQLGVPLTSVQYMLMYNIEATGDYALWAESFVGSGSSFRFIAAKVAVGYWPISRYPSPRSWTEFSAGCEVYSANDQVTMSGEILGIGTSLASQPINGQFQLFGPGNFNEQYFSASWGSQYNGNRYNAPHGVSFSGTETQKRK